MYVHFKEFIGVQFPLRLKESYVIETSHCGELYPSEEKVTTVSREAQCFQGRLSLFCPRCLKLEEKHFDHVRMVFQRLEQSL